MKRAVSFCLTLALVLALTACGAPARQGGADSGPETGGEPPVSVTPETPPAAEPDDGGAAGDEAPEEPNTPEEPDDSGKKILIAYFSATNNTESIANHLKDILDADLHEIVPETPYTSDDLNYNTDCRANREQNDAGARPAISGGVEDMTRYEVVFLGYPIWWGQAPKVIYTFLESYDLDGKTIVPFCTSGSSGIGSSAANLHDLASGAEWLDGQRFSGGASASDVQSWVEGLGLTLAPGA